MFHETKRDVSDRKLYYYNFLFFVLYDMSKQKPVNRRI